MGCKMRTEKQRAATKRNHEIMRLKGIMAHTHISLFTAEESHKINEICRAALIRNGVSYNYDYKEVEQQKLFPLYESLKPNKSDVKC